MVRSWTALVALLPLGGCFYTDRINSRPDAKIQLMDDDGLVYFRDDLVLVSAGGDPDNDSLTYDWSARSCPTVEQCLPEPIETGSSSMFGFRVPDKTPITVILRVTDQDGAFDEDQIRIAVSNRAPEITKLQVEGPTNNLGGYTLGRLLEIRAEFSDLDTIDELTAAWMPYPAPDSPPGSTAFTAISDTEATLRPDAVGNWIIELTVSDGEASVTDDLTIRVDPDRDPCIGPLSPMMATADAPILVERALGLKSFRVASVIDDLDPYPHEVGSTDPNLGRPEFQWWIQRPGGALELVPGSDLAEYGLNPTAYAPGDELTLRVEVRDRYPIPDPNWPACPVDEPTCASATDDPTCIQRATWHVRIQ